MVKNVFLLHFSNTFEIDISKILGSDNCIHLIGSQNLIFNEQISRQHAFFSSVLFVENFDITAIRDHIKSNTSEPFDSIEIVTNTEKSVELCGELRILFGLSKVNYTRFTDKEVMKDRLKNSEVAIPKFTIFDPKYFQTVGDVYLSDIEEYIEYPYFIKPINQAGCFGANIVNDRIQFINWINTEHSLALKYEIDEFIEGELYHCDSLIKNGEIIHTEVCLYSEPCFSYLSGRAIGSITLPNTIIETENLKRLTLIAHKAIGIPDNGCTHLEIFKSQKGNFIFLEIAFRTPGVGAGPFYERRLGISLPEIHLKLQIDKTFLPQIKNENFVARFVIPNNLESINYFDSLDIKCQNSKSLYNNPTVTENVQNRIGNNSGYVVFWDSDFNVVKAEFDRIYSDLQLINIRAM
jgi:biotin carboxylase